MFCGYYRKMPYCGPMGLGPVGGYGGMYAPAWMMVAALGAAYGWSRARNCMGRCGRRPGCMPYMDGFGCR